MEPISEEALSLARVIWDYHQLRHEPIPADVIVALGTNDLRVADFAADLYLRGFGSTLVCSGGVAHQDDLLATSWEKTEAEMYADLAERRGVPREHMLLERRARNTAENIRFTRELLGERKMRPRNIVIAVKPFMQRRVWATMAVEWPEMPATLASPEMTLEEYFTSELGLCATRMVGSTADSGGGAGSLSGLGWLGVYEASDCGGMTQLPLQWPHAHQTRIAALIVQPDGCVEGADVPLRHDHQRWTGHRSITIGVGSA
jgi:hypothetical protein